MWISTVQIFHWIYIVSGASRISCRVGVDPLGHVDLQCRCFSAKMNVKTKELGPMWGVRPARQSANDCYRYFTRLSFCHKTQKVDKQVRPSFIFIIYAINFMYMETHFSVNVLVSKHL